MFIAESASEKKLKSVNISQSYKQERDCLVHFLRPLAVCWPGYMGSGIGPEAYNVTAACRSETIATQQLAIRRRHVLLTQVLPSSREVNLQMPGVG